MTTAALLSRAQNGGVGNAGEPKPTRRRFSADYKLAILKEYDEAERGERGEILRREGLYSSQLMDWRLQRDEAAARQLEPKARQSKLSPEAREIERLQRQNAKLTEQVEKHRKALAIQGKVSGLLARLLAESTPENEPQQPES